MPSLLVIDDELETLDYLKLFFQRPGIEVLTAASGEEGLTLIGTEKPDLVLLDLRLGPGLSGMEVLRRVKATDSQTKVIVVTAVDDQNVADMVKGLGAIDYMNKPFNISDLEKTVLPRLKPA